MIKLMGVKGRDVAYVISNLTAFTMCSGDNRFRTDMVIYLFDTIKGKMVTYSLVTDVGI